jgi:hypothetical protein
LDHRAAAGNAGGECHGNCDLFRPPGETEDVVGREAAHQQRGGGAADTGEHRGPPGGTVVDSVAGDDGLGQAEPLFEVTLLFVVQILLQRRGHDDLDAHQALGLGPADQPPGSRAGDAEAAGDLRLGQSVEVVQGGRTQREPQIFGGGAGGTHGTGRDLAVRRRSRHDFHPPPSSLNREHMLTGACRCSSR